METQTVMLDLPESLYQAARQLAEVTGQPIEAVLQASSAQALPPLDDVPPEQRGDLAALTALGDAELWQVARETLSELLQQELESLLNQQAEGVLSAGYLKRLQDLMELYGQVTLHKAHAYLLLARRGYRVPMQNGVE